ncbi:MAG: CHAT domain-containing protein [Egibacteraceae bacterium]
MGLASALFALGARTMIASVVPVPDAATTSLMTALHDRLREGLEPAEALAQAQVQNRRQWLHGTGGRRGIRVLRQRVSPTLHDAVIGARLTAPGRGARRRRAPRRRRVGPVRRVGRSGGHGP